MSPDRPRLLPISTRHAFALAFDLAARRDPLQSLIIPLLLRSPWILALALLPAPTESKRPDLVLLVSSVALLGDFFAHITVGAMLRFRARSVFNTPHDTAPAPALECYAAGVARVPWLFVTEVVRNLAIVFAFFFFVLPAVFLGHRLSFATEAVVLNERHLAGAFRRSFNLTQHRFERWLEMIALSVLLCLGLVFVVAALSVFIPGPSATAWAAIMWLLVAAVMPVIQYAWTFFYLRLVEVEVPGIEVGPAYAGAPPWPAEAGPPQLTLVEPPAGPAPGSDPST